MVAIDHVTNFNLFGKVFRMSFKTSRGWQGRISTSVEEAFGVGGDWKPEVGPGHTEARCLEGDEESRKDRLQ